MIDFTTGNLLESPAVALVNTVNTVGVMGKGIALQFKYAFPNNYDVYKAACQKGTVAIGKILAVKDRDLFNTYKLILNMPTKTHWRLPSQYDYVDLGLMALKEYLIINEIPTLAMPAPGCGNGGLNWERVKSMVDLHLSELECMITVFIPSTV